MNICDISLTDKRDLSIYDNEIFAENLNEYNRITKDNIGDIKEYCNKAFFKVPYYDKKMIWGEERIFYPFSDKLFKIITAEHNDLSVQLHPLKSEEWIPLINSEIFDGYNIITVSPDKKVSIEPNTVHGIKKGSKVFEIQDNMIFDSGETIRIYDSNGRETDEFPNIYKHLMPQVRGKLKIEDIITRSGNNIVKLEKDTFLFIIDGSGSLDLSDEKVNLEKEQLYFINSDYINQVEVYGNVYMCSVTYYVASESTRMI